jgi:F-type H+-transporting ATPase subunit delta
MLSVVASRYAKALVDVVTETPGLNSADVVDQLHSVQALIASSQELRGVLASPAVSPSRKRSVMSKLIAPLDLLTAVRNFVLVVIDHRRIDEFNSIVEGFETLLDERLGYVRADVRSAHELSPEQRGALEAQVARVSGRKARLKYSIDPALIAGVVARVGSTVYDGSVRGQLDKLRARLGR